MDFTREPIIETIITPKEGCKLVIRSSKNAGQEEYFVDAVEVIAFGNAFFFRSLERPKSFLVPVSDYEVLEVREARMVLKNVGLERSIKIGGGRDAGAKASRDVEKAPVIVREEEEREEQEESVARQGEAAPEGRLEGRIDKKRDRRRNYRKRRGREEREEGPKEEGVEGTEPVLEEEPIDIIAPEAGVELSQEAPTPLSPSMLSSLLQPPPTLISETINRYRQNEMFKGAFYLTEEEQYKPHDKVQDLLDEDDEEEEAPLLEEPVFVENEGAVEAEVAEPAANEAIEIVPESERKRVGPPPIPPELIRDRSIEAALPLYAEEERVENGEEEERKHEPEVDKRHDFDKPF